MTTREIINLGTAANDGTGDTFRSGGTKINNNFAKLFQHLGGDSNNLSVLVKIDSDGIIFEGTLVDSFYTILKANQPTAINTINLPNTSGSIVIHNATQNITNKSISASTIEDLRIVDSSGSFTFDVRAPGIAANRTINLPTLSDSDTFAVTDAFQTLLNKTLTTPSITSPDITTGINDVNGSQMIAFAATGSSVLNFSMTNAAAAGTPIFGVIGTDSDIDLTISAKNRGAVVISKAAYVGQTITAAGAIPASKSYIDFNSGVGIAITLANGTLAGEFKKMTNRGAGTVTVTPTSFANGTSFALAQNEACEVIWDGTNWFVLANQSVLTIT